MTRFAMIVAVFLFPAGLLPRSLAQEAGPKDAQKSEHEHLVSPIPGVTKFAVTGRSTRFRLTASTPAGGTIQAPVIKGKAILIRESNVIEVGPEGKPTIGVTRKEFVFRGTEAGNVVIEITKTTPGQPMPVVERFEIEIK
jgi:hypothetical protein